VRSGGGGLRVFEGLAHGDHRGVSLAYIEGDSQVRGEALRADFYAAEAVGSQPLSPLLRRDIACSWTTLTPWAIIATLYVLLPR
jgi:hypothetical protein